MTRHAQLRFTAWTGFVVAALLLLDVLDLTVYGVVVSAAAVALALAFERRELLLRLEVDRLDLAVIGGLYVGVVGLFAIAFRGFTTERTAGLFLTFAAGLLLGVVGPLVYTVWIRGRPLATLGLTLRNWRPAVALALLFAAIQFALTLYGYDLPPTAEDWLPLLVMSLVVGAFEAVFFRGFVQGRLETSLGAGPAVFGAAGLYALYHVGYAMGGSEIVFLFGLGVVYALAYRLTENVLVLWPLLTPLGAFYNNLEAADIELPWASIAGFADVLAAFAIAIALAARHERRRGRGELVPATLRQRLLGRYLTRAYLRELGHCAPAPLAGRPFRRAVRGEARQIIARTPSALSEPSSAAWLQLAALALASTRVLTANGLDRDAARDVVQAALIGPTRRRIKPYLRLRFGISQRHPERAFAAVSASMKRGGERTFGAYFDYEQTELSAARCVVCIHRCLFHDLLAAHGAVELTGLFCALDSVWADELARPRYRVRFKRPATIAHGAPACRFEFAAATTSTPRHSAGS